MGWGSGVAMSCGVDPRGVLDPMLLWLWCKPAAAALIEPLAWEPPYAAMRLLEKKKRTKSTPTTISGVRAVVRWVKKLISVAWVLWRCSFDPRPGAVG